MNNIKNILLLISLIILIILPINFQLKTKKIKKSYNYVSYCQLKPIKIKYKKFNYDKIIKKLIIIETNGNTNLIGDNGTALGLLQIRPIAIKDCNRINKTSFKHSDALDSLKATKICKLILKSGVKLYKKKHDSLPNEEQVVRMWNGGIYKGYTYTSTKKYWKKYKKLKI